jgi:L-iditol 2-dehydrogenase
MKAMRLAAEHRIEACDVPTPGCKNPNDVLLRLQRVGVCGSDVHYFTTGRIGSMVVDYPFTLGHECSAEVAAVGGGVAGVRPGDRVAVDPAISCGACDQCRIGRRHTCRNLAFLGCPGQLEGCLSEYIVMPEQSCYPIPDSLSFDDAAIAEPLSIGLYAVMQAGAISNASIGILGAGPIGLSVLVCAKAFGAKFIGVTERLDYRADLALKNGATWAGNVDKNDAVQDICDAVPEKLDVVFECSGTQEAFDQGIEMLKPGGKMMIIGIPEFDRYSFSADVARRNEICLQHVRRQNECVQAALNLIAEDKVDASFMHTHSFPLEKAQDAFELVENYADGVVKAMITY